ncbi:MAG: excisionase family DNA-binding protein [Acidimicrobiales bacterium]
MSSEPRWTEQEEREGRVIPLPTPGDDVAPAAWSAGRLLVSPEIASDLLCIGRTKLYELLASGDIESVRLGSCRRIPMQALEDFVSRLRRSRRPPGVTAGRDDFGASEIGGGV